MCERVATFLRGLPQISELGSSTSLPFGASGLGVVDSLG